MNESLLEVVLVEVVVVLVVVVLVVVARAAVVVTVPTVQYQLEKWKYYQPLNLLFQQVQNDQECFIIRNFSHILKLYIL